MSHHVLRSAAAMLVAAAPAFAGSLDQVVDLDMPATPTVVAPAPLAASGTDWTGFYVGGQLGFGRLNLDNDQDAIDGLDSDGALFGLHAGYMRDFGRLVVGGEIDFDGAGITIDNRSGDLAEVSSIARAKLRAGYNAGRIMPYITAGFARLVLNSDDPSTQNLLEDSYNGGFAGLGASYALTDRFVVGAEVLRHRFEDAITEDFDIDATTITLRSSIRF